MRRFLPVAFALLLLVAACAAPSADDDNVVGDDPELNSANVSLVVPFIDEKHKLLSQYNDKAKAKGLKETPDTFEVKNQADAQAYYDLHSYFTDTVEEAVGAKDQAMPAWGPDSYTSWSKSKKSPGLCYKGNPNKVVGLLEQMTDTVFSDQLTIQGWKYKKAKHFENDSADYESDFPDTWAEWRGDGLAVLVIFTQGDGGDDLTAAIIPRCK